MKKTNFIFFILSILFFTACKKDVTEFPSVKRNQMSGSSTGYKMGVTPSISACSEYFYDSGGNSGDYSNNEDYVETIYPATLGKRVSLTFTSFNIEDISYQGTLYDYLDIYNGTSTSSPFIGEYYGTNSPGTVIATNSSGAITLVFNADVSGVFSGWKATIQCVY